MEWEVRRRAAFLVATNILEEATLPDLALIQTYRRIRLSAPGLRFWGERRVARLWAGLP
jgi:hypothetical protein